MYCFPDFFFNRPMFSYSSLSYLNPTSLNQLGWILYQVNLWICMSLGATTRRLSCSFCGVVFPWFCMFLKVLHCCLGSWSRSHLFQCLLTNSRREIPSISPAKYLEAFPYLLWMCLLHTSCTFMSESVRFYAFFWSCNRAAQVLTASLLISQGLH